MLEFAVVYCNNRLFAASFPDERNDPWSQSQVTGAVAPHVLKKLADFDGWTEQNGWVTTHRSADE